MDQAQENICESSNKNSSTTQRPELKFGCLQVYWPVAGRGPSRGNRLISMHCRLISASLVMAEQGTNLEQRRGTGSGFAVK